MKLRRFTAKDWAWNRDTGDDSAVLAAVNGILSAVRKEGDKALRRFTVQYDGLKSNMEDWNLRVSPEDMERAWKGLSASLQEALSAAAKRIRVFHETQKTADVNMEGPDGERLGLTWRPLGRVGVYAPGGQAAYPSTVLMDVLPAQVAGVEEIVLVSPPVAQTGLPHPLVMAAAHLVGIREMYRIGGAQAVGALAYGTTSIQRVDKVVGPGNIYVATAKRLVNGTVGIDSIAGPSEVFIIADETANPEFIAADMLAQAEHDAEAGAVCIVLSEEMAQAVEQAVEKQLQVLPKKEICEESLSKWGALILADSLPEAVSITNISAPEHLELLVENPAAWLPQVQTAGAVFLGSYSPEPVGDYYAGTNHVLPTHGSARFASGLGVYDFLRRMSYVQYGEDTLAKHSRHIIDLAEAEGLVAHAKSIQARMNRRDFNGS